MRRRFVGRAAELAALEAALAGAGEGRPEVVLVGGEAGVGKTRLVRELADRAAARGTLVATGACVELTAGTAPYLAFTEALRDLARAVGPRAWERMCAGAPPELAGLLPGASGASGERVDSAARARLLGQAYDLLVEVTATAPLLLVLEDVHWADRSTLDLAGFLARSVRDEPIALVATFRSDETPRRPALRAWLAELARAEGVRRIELEPFGEAEIAELLASIDGAAPDPATVASIARRSGGNAFLAEELHDAAGGDAGLPASMRDLLAVRIAALPRPAQTVLRAAAAAGARVDDELLAGLVDLPASELGAALRAAVAHHLLAADPRDGRLAFRHELVREAAYAELLPGERRKLHAACARVLAARPELGESPASAAASVARHWDAAGEADSALGACLRAAGAAVSVHAPAEALVLYRRALALWEQVADAEGVAGTARLDVFERAANAAVQAGEARIALGLLDDALALADPVAEPVRTGVLHSQRAWYSWAAGAAGPSTYEHHTSALALIPAEPPSAARARAVTDLAYTLMLDGEMRTAREQADEAVAVARRSGAREVEGLALNVLGATRGMLGENEDAVENLREAVAIARETGGTEALGRAYVNFSSALDIAGRYEEAVEAALEGAAISRRLGMARHWSAFLAGNAAESMVTLGRLDEARALVEDTLAHEVSTLASLHLWTLSAELALERGDHAACATALATTRELGVSGHSAEMAGTTARIAADLATDLRRYEEARAAVREGLERQSDDARLVSGLVAAGIAIEAAVAERARAAGHDAGVAPAMATARELLGRLDALGAGRAVPSARALAQTARAEATRLGDPAPELWREAAGAWEALGAPHRAGWARLREAEALLAAGAGRREAAAPLRLAATAARRTGALRLLREVELLAARARIDVDAAPAREPEAPAGLTPREREVLVHLAAGRTNRQIADALYISPRTAGVHVSRILAKLGATTRGEAAAAGRLAGVIDEERVAALLTRSTG
jgi:DNA-binding CsgD family transcriptional regulator/tetratricopeptide (TPR) repeat protein